MIEMFNVGDNVFYILRKGTGSPRETYIPAKVDSYDERTKMYVAIMPDGKPKKAIPERNLSVKNHRGEFNEGRK